ncbi:sarcosine oxidase [Mollisia scopiformis]|uniref:Sarcosine oxidase n=1 Tax=Mollisia scopiformis TaxID=149040 RepID=A0A132B5E1_MOLSC|nr:sarcosine oxidase [Mollisia scopiformis]KUJ07463.1 sarcosine oxidase [Mollisia scopiformis]
MDTKSSSAHESYLVLGAGCFGASTAYHLKQTLPASSVTLLDRGPFPNPSAAGHDLNKIIRADYQDIFYMKLALEAQQYWRRDPIYRPYYHESGMLYAEDKGMARANLDNLNAVGEKHHAEILTPEETRAKFDGGEADRALESVISAAVKEGVIYNSSGVSTLCIDESAICTGVRTEDGAELKANRVILCTGAWTPKLLLDTAPHNKALHIGDRMVAAGAIQCTASYPPDQMYKFKSMPVMFNGCDHTEGECIPPTPQKMLKFNYEVSFTNKEFHDGSGQTISVPPARLDQSTWSQAVPQGLKKDEIHTVVDHVFGKWIDGIKIEDYRICWDAVTPNQDFIIDRHPNCKNLYFAGAGSFHSWKFLPTLGKYVLDMLQGTLDAEKASRWAWDRPNQGSALPAYVPRRDLKEIPGYEDVAKHFK